LDFGFAGLVDVPMRDFADRARLVESLGYDYFWVPDERLLRNVYTGLTVAGLNTERIQLGTAVTNPYTRHPALTAAAIATVDEVSGGRTILGLGAGGGLDAYGIQRPSPVSHIKETVEVVRLLTGGLTGDYEGKHFSLENTHLDFKPLRPIPIFIAARGPKILELAGEVADGVIIGGFAQQQGVEFAMRHVDAGLAKSRRAREDIYSVAWIFISVSDARDEARRAVSRMVMAAMLSSRPILSEIGVELPKELESELDRNNWQFRQVPHVAELLTDEIIDTFAVYGTPEDCAEKLLQISRSDFDQIAFVALPPTGATIDESATVIAETIIPALSNDKGE